MSCIIIVPGCELETVEQEIQRLMDEFLDVYSLYLETELRCIKKQAIIKAYDIHMLDPKFSCVV